MSTKCVVHLHLHLHVARKQLPDDLQERVRNYYDYSYHRHKLLDHTSFLHGLSESLADEVSLYLCVFRHLCYTLPSV